MTGELDLSTDAGVRHGARRARPARGRPPLRRRHRAGVVDRAPSATSRRPSTATRSSTSSSTARSPSSCSCTSTSSRPGRPGRRPVGRRRLRIRDVLKFEFFFARKRDFDLELRDELALIDPEWERREAEPGAAVAALARTHLLLAPRVLTSFLEAYLVVAERLAAHDPAQPVDEERAPRRVPRRRPPVPAAAQARQHRVDLARAVRDGAQARRATAVCSSRTATPPRSTPAARRSAPRSATLVERIGRLRALALAPRAVTTVAEPARGDRARAAGAGDRRVLRLRRDADRRLLGAGVLRGPDPAVRAVAGRADPVADGRCSRWRSDGADVSKLMEVAVANWAGHREEEVRELFDRLFYKRISGMVYPEARELVKAHPRAGHTVALASSATRYQLAALADDLGSSTCCARRSSSCGGTSPATFAGRCCGGRRRRRACVEFAADRGVDLERQLRVRERRRGRAVPRDRSVMAAGAEPGQRAETSRRASAAGRRSTSAAAGRPGIGRRGADRRGARRPRRRRRASGSRSGC